MPWMATSRSGFGIALGGGTARAVAHVGVLEVLAERGWRAGAIAGTSSGAMIGAMAALGMSATEIAALVRGIDVRDLWRQALDPGIDQASLIRGRRLEAWLDRHVFQGATFDDLQVPFVVACTDLVTGDLGYLSHGRLARAVVASSALAGFFSPVIDGDRVWVDGGFVEAVPFRTLAQLRPQRSLGLHAGIDAGRSRVIALVRWLHGTPAGARWRDWLLARGATGPWRRLARGTALAAHSYERGLDVPPGARLLSTAPRVAWWDFHRMDEAIAAGRLAAETAFERDGLEAWLAGEPDAAARAESRPGPLAGEVVT
jgi:predicted acylesterase/phospholipase RssA